MPDVTFEKLGGLNLVADPQEAGAQQALSCLNVSLDRNGRVRTRDGYTSAYNSAITAYPLAIHPVSGNTVLTAISANKVRVVDLNAGTSAAEVALTALSSSFASAGSSAVYFTDGTTTQIRKFAGGAFSSPAGLAAYEGNYLAVQPLDDRLVIADANSTSKLWFSDPATPETINVSNFLSLTPGDGQAITGMAVYGTELFVFKPTKFFVFYGNSTDATGGSVFNYRMVDTGVGCNSGFSLKSTATHETGVYFVGIDGVYRTTGGSPVKVSTAIDPVFTGMNLPVPAPFSSVASQPLSNFYNLAVASDKLHLFGTVTGSPFTAGDTLQFVMDLRTGEWTVYGLKAGSMLDGDLVGYPGQIVLGAANGANEGILAKMGRASSDDAGTAISWHHQSGFYDLGSQKSKRIHRTELWGSGTPTLSIFTDHGSSDANAAAVTLGAAPAVARGWHSKAYRGVLFSHKLSGTSAATIHRIGHTVADERVAQ